MIELFVLAALLLVSILVVVSQRHHLSCGSLLLFFATSVLFVWGGFATLVVQSDFAAQGLLGLRVVTLGCVTFALFGLLWRSARTPTPPSVPRGSRATKRSSMTIGWLFVAVSALYFVLLGSVPLLQGLGSLFSPGASEGAVNVARVNRDIYINSDARYIPMQGLFEAFRYFGLPMAFIWALQAWRDHPVSARLLCLASVLVAVGTAQRWPLVYFLLATLLAVSRTPRQVRSVNLGRVGGAWLVVSVALTAALGRNVRGDEGNFVDVILTNLGGLLSRVFVDQARTPFLSYFSGSPELHAQNGATYVQSLLSYLPGAGASYPVTFYRLVTGDQIGYTAPPDAFTEAWVNFGAVGVVLFAGVWSCVLGLVDVWADRARDEQRFAANAVLMVALGFSAFTGVMFVLGSVIIWVIAAVWLRLAEGPDIHLDATSNRRAKSSA